MQIGTSTVNNGRLVNSGSAGSDAVITSTTTLNDVTLEGQWTHSPGVTVTLRGVTDGSGTLLVNIGNVGATTTVNADEDVVLAGDGSIRLGGVASRARIISGAGVNITQGMNRSVIGFGQLLSGFVNNGLVRANVDGQSLLVSGQDKLNNAVFDAVDGGILEFQSTTFDQTGGGLIEADGGTASFSNTTMLGGTVRNTGAPGSEISIETNTFDSVVIDGDSTLVPGRTLTIGGTALTNDGLLSVNPTNVGAVTTLSAGEHIDRRSRGHPARWHDVTGATAERDRRTVDARRRSNTQRDRSHRRRDIDPRHDRPRAECRNLDRHTPRRARRWLHLRLRVQRRRCVRSVRQQFERCARRDA
ncbi:MAG: hypothetical protein ACFHWZ_03135 [Phycisphaerales bacterium]